MEMNIRAGLKKSRRYLRHSSDKERESTTLHYGSASTYARMPLEPATQKKSLCHGRSAPDLCLQIAPVYKMRGALYTKLVDVVLTLTQVFIRLALPPVPHQAFRRVKRENICLLPIPPACFQALCTWGSSFTVSQHKNKCVCLALQVCV